ncbi:MAG: hypothetical protein MUF83_17590 [Acidimicrobiales bacterium]|jgi:hypothetical protein|nr:hypothetical protein [Acidimicrobiales bacterium]
MPAPEVLFIASLQHSGSTYLDLQLSSHGAWVGVGEISGAVRTWLRTRATVSELGCTCGAAPTDCVFWGAVIERLAADDVRTLAQGYATVQMVFGEVFGPDVSMVDSSKHGTHLELAARGSSSLAVLRLTRDVRSWIASEQSRRKRDATSFAGRVRCTAPYLARLWYRRNRILDREVASTGLPTMRVGYEESVFHHERVLDDVDRFVARHLGRSITTGTPPGAHIVRGNRMRLDPVQRAAITYDDAWLCRGALLHSSALVPPIRSYNRRMVYGA